MAKRKRWRDPFADYIEWTEHRYDPGYYLGGRLPPYLKKSALGPKGRRNVGILLTMSGLIGFAEVIIWQKGVPLDTGLLVVAASWPVLLVAAGIAMFAFRSEPKGGSKSRPK